MIICCISQNKDDWLGYSDKYYIPNINSANELKKYTDNNLPLSCYKVVNYAFDNIAYKEDLEEVSVYLNNYLYFKDITNSFFIMPIEEVNQLYNNYCSKCINEDKYCGNFKFDENKNCKNFKEKLNIKIINKLKNIFK